MEPSAGLRIRVREANPKLDDGEVASSVTLMTSAPIFMLRSQGTVRGNGLLWQRVCRTRSLLSICLEKRRSRVFRARP